MEHDDSPRIDRHEAPDFDCSQPLPPEVIAGFEFFNTGKFFEAHEELEIAWRREEGAIRDMYRGILQVGVGYYHIQRHNYRGARKMFLRCRQWLAPFPDLCCGIDLGRFRRDYEAIEAQIRQPDLPENATFTFQPIYYKVQSSAINE